jgi:O-antigen/teichoic acid export membrane protein/tetratricopeptide (TPR) repeat protein
MVKADESRDVTTAGRKPGRKQFLQDNVLATGSTLIAGFLGFGLQAMSSHVLSPGGYGKAFAVISFYTLVVRPASAIGRLVAWQTSRELATGDEMGPGSIVLLRETTLWMLLIGLIVAVLSVLGGSVLGSYLHVSVLEIGIAAASAPFLLGVQPLLGTLQGQQRFVPWSALSVVVALSNLVFVAAFVFELGTRGVLLGVTVGSIVTFLVCLGAVWRSITSYRGSPRTVWSPFVPFIVTGLASTLAIGVFVGADVIIVEHFFDKVQAGQYASVAAIGNAVFFGTGGVASVVFPLIAARHGSGRSTYGVMGGTFALCAAATITGTVFLGFFGHFVLLQFSGERYVGGAHILGWYALGMGIVGWVVILVNTQQSLNRLTLLWVLVPTIILRPALLLVFHGTLLTVVVVSDLSAAVLALVLMVMYVVNERTRRRKWRPADDSSIEPVSSMDEVFVAPVAPIPADFALASVPAAAANPVVAATPVSYEPAPTSPEPPAGPQHLPDAEVTGPLRGVRTRLMVRTRPFVDRPTLSIVAIAVFGVVIRHAWISTRPLAAGDWHWPTKGRLAAWFPWPSPWNDTLGLSGENRFLDVFRFPVYAVNGALSEVGASWTVIEKVVYYLPFAVLLPVAGWLLAREVMGPTRWALVSPLLLLGNTYFLIEGNGEIPLVLGEAIGCLALVAFLRAMRRTSARWGILTGILVAAAAAMDIRPAVLTVGMAVIYLVVLTAADPGLRSLVRRLGVGALAGGVFLGLQMFWVVPLLTYHGHPSFPTPKAPDFSIITLGNGIAGVMAEWSGGTPAAFVEAPLNPMFMLLPVVAMLPLVRRRIRPEIVWLALCAVICAFLAKTNTPPFGGLYDLLYTHVPGFNLFREGSKFFYPIGIAYAVLIPAAFGSLLEMARGMDRTRRRALQAGTAAALLCVVAIATSTIVVLERGQLGSTTTPVAEPQSFSQLTKVLAADHHRGSVLWFGTSSFTTGAQQPHQYNITSATHPEENLTGTVNSTAVEARDPLQYFCPVISQAYCYVNRQVFPYLVHMVGATYIVSPAGQDVGQLPSSITNSWLRQQLGALFGTPRVLGNAKTELYVWHVSAPAPLVANYPAVALVDSGPWSLGSVLPALEAMGIPGAYRQTFDRSDYPPAPADLPSSVTVIPRVNNGCLGTSSTTTVGIMARSTASDQVVRIGSSTRTLPRLTGSTRLPGWSVYGPVSIPAGQTAMISEGSVTLGPCVAWSPLAMRAFGAHGQPAGTAVTTANGERIRSPLVGRAGPWTLLRQIYDPGWRLAGKPPATVGNGLFNLYDTAPGVNSHRHLGFAFSTIRWERIGQTLSFLVLLGSLILLLVIGRRRPRQPPVRPIADFETPRGSITAVLGLMFLGLAGLATLTNWLGIPSRYPLLAVTGDPYSLDVVFGTGALGLLLLSLLGRLATARSRVRTARVTTPRHLQTGGSRRWVKGAAVMTSLAVIAGGCAASSGNANQILQSAQRAGATSRNIEGSSLDAARIQQAANNPTVCIADYTKALKTFTKLASAYAGRAGCYQSNGLNDPAAIHDFDRALQLEPGQPSLLIDRASAYRGIGQLDDAADDYRAVAADAASDQADTLTAIDGLIAVDQLAWASQVLQTAMARFPDDPLIHLGVADLAVAENDDGRARQALSQANRLVPTGSADAVTVTTEICSFELARQEYRQAVASCGRASQLSQTGAGAFDDLASAEAGLGQVDVAVQDLSSAIGAFVGSVGPNAQPGGVDGFGLSFLYEAQGRLYVELHQIGRAVNDYQLARQALAPGAVDFAARLKADILSAERD